MCRANGSNFDISQTWILVKNCIEIIIFYPIWSVGGVRRLVISRVTSADIDNVLYGYSLVNVTCLLNISLLLPRT